ncbi:uncharacterized protein LOC117011330 isoform X2 [Catharus ustulatus]|uniref:uncharacterized protein LOC117011330 isoform X2 n=1 Tax=Catharus ustulatus TaxID=91951 RepID=UPI00140BDDA3|nr:uncharacterized protein LOC117011330 isoform X2 [Catharus ustulatus]
MSREVDPKGCHLLEKSSQLVSQSTEPIKRSVEIHAGSEELLPFPGDRGLTSGKTTEREEEENAEVVNGDHQSKEGSGSDENCVGSVSAQAGSERNNESFPDDSSEDPVEGSESSIKPKIPLSDPVVVPNFFLPPQEMEASMTLLSTSSHPSASPEGPVVCLDMKRSTGQSSHTWSLLLWGEKGAVPGGIPYRRADCPRPSPELSEESPGSSLLSSPRGNSAGQRPCPAELPKPWPDAWQRLSPPAKGRWKPQLPGSVFSWPNWSLAGPCLERLKACGQPQGAVSCRGRSPMRLWVTHSLLPALQVVQA